MNIILVNQQLIKNTSWRIIWEKMRMSVSNIYNNNKYGCYCKWSKDEEYFIKLSNQASGKRVVDPSKVVITIVYDFNYFLS